MKFIVLVIARIGVGYDMVDLQACIDADVAVTITPQGIHKPVAYSILTMCLIWRTNFRLKAS